MQKDKQTVIESVTSNKSKKEYSYPEVLALLQSVKIKATAKPTHAKVGDVFITHMGSNKSRPCLVISKRKDGVFLCVNMTTTKDHNVVCNTEGRFGSEENFIAAHVGLYNEETICDNFIYCYDNPSHIPEIRKQLRNKLKI